MYLASQRANRKWYLDSGCLRHMTGDESQFITLDAKNGGMVTFGDNGKGKIIGIGNIGIAPFKYIKNILLVDGLKYNLLSISQFCDKGYKVIFESSVCIITSPINEGIKFIGHRHGNIYMVDLNDLFKINMQCLVALNAKINETSWLWHRKLAHISMHSLSKLIKKKLIIGLPKLNFEKDRIYDVCQLGKQTKYLSNLKILFQLLGH